MDFIDTISLTEIQSLLVALACLVIVWQGRLEWAVAIYLAMAGWTRTVEIWSFASTWVFLATMILSWGVYRLKCNNVTLLATEDRWIVSWMGIWWAWMLLLIALNMPENLVNLLRSLLLFTIIPLPFILQFATNVRRVRGFAVAYIATTMIGGWFALNVLRIPLEYVLNDPTLTRYGVIRLGIVNYHWFAYCFAISLIFVTALFLSTRQILVKALLIVCVSYCTYFLFLLGSRQAIAGAAGAVILIILWWAVQGQGGGARWLNVGVVLGLIILIAVATYQAAPELIVRPSDGDLGGAYNIVANRGEYWEIGWQAFIESPLWGTGFTRYIAHNIFVGTLAEQGLVGLCFFAGFLIFILRQALNVRKMRDEDDHEQAVWRATALGVIIFGLIHSQASGSVISVWHLYWGGALLWRLGYKSRVFVSQHRPVAISRFTRTSVIESSDNTFPR